MNNVLNQIMPHLRLRGYCRRTGCVREGHRDLCPWLVLAAFRHCCGPSSEVPTPPKLFLLLGTTSFKATPHSHGVWAPALSAEPELINSLFPGLHWVQRQLEAPVSFLNSSFTLVLKHLSSSVLLLHGTAREGCRGTGTPRAGEGTASGGSVIWGGEHIWAMRPSALYSRFASKAQL